MRVDMTEERKKQIAAWSVRTKGYKVLSDKALELLEVMSDGLERQRTDMFRAAGYEANRISEQGNSWTDMTDFRLYNSGLIDVRATGIKDKRWDTWNGVTTYWTINEKGLAALSASYVGRISIGNV